ncbi:MAG: hypothetical protein QWI37_04075 [Candidatus Cardinium sp.]|nr:hypothetical protein [Candidatus Cardinium sp.]
MVYKKIRNTIPSLSSLLLAGVLLAGCQDGKCTENADGSANTQSKDQKPTVAEEGVKKTERSKSFIDSLRDIYYSLFRFTEVGAIVDNASGIVIRPEVVNLQQLELLDGSELKKSGEAFFQKFSDEDNLLTYPSSLRELVRPLQHMPKFRTGASKSGIQNKYAYISAANTIAQGVHQLYDFAEQVKGAITSSFSECVSLEDALSKAFNISGGIKQYKEGLKDIFSKKHAFNNSRNSYLKSGALAMIKTFTTKESSNNEENGNEDKKQETPISLLGEKISILIKNRKDPHLLPQMALDDLSKKGSIPKDQWYVLDDKGGKSKYAMFQVDDFTGSLKKKFNYIDISAGESPESGSYGEEALDLKFNQILLLLFTSTGNNINKELNFLALEHRSDDKENTVRLVGHNDTFKSLEHYVQNRNYKSFASTLGKYIENDPELKEFFVIPNENEIMDLIFSEIDSVDQSVANIGGNRNSDSIYGKLGTQSLSLQIVKNILHNLFNVPFKDDLEMHIKSIVSSYHKKEFNETTALFKHRVGARILSELIYGEGKKIDDDIDNNSVLFSRRQTGQDLIQAVRDVVRKSLEECAVLFLNNGNYQPTSVTKQILLWVKDLSDLLVARRDSKSVDYKDLEDTVNTAIKGLGAGNNTPFSIDKFCKAMEHCCGQLEAVLSAKVSDFLDSDSKQNAKSFFDKITLSDPRFDVIDKYKEKYRRSMINTSEDASQNL